MDCKFKIGDTVILNEDYMNFKKGDIGVVDDIDDADDPSLILYYLDMNNGKRIHGIFGYRLKKYTAPKTTEWKVVNRPVKKGDYIRLTCDAFSFAKTGCVLKVDRVNWDGIYAAYVKEQNLPEKPGCTPEPDYEWCFLAFEFEVVEKVTTKHKRKPVAPKECKLRASFADKSYGVCGTPTAYKDARGEPLFVGDVVELIDIDNHMSHGEKAIVERETCHAFVMGIQMDCAPDTGRISHDWVILKTKSYRDMKPGDRVDTIKYV